MNCFLICINKKISLFTLFAKEVDYASPWKREWRGIFICRLTAGWRRHLCSGFPGLRKSDGNGLFSALDLLAAFAAGEFTLLEFPHTLMNAFLRFLAVTCHFSLLYRVFLTLHLFESEIEYETECQDKVDEDEVDYVPVRN